MKGLQLKYMEIIFDKQKPQSVGTNIKIIAKAESNIDLEYKFIVGKGGVWAALQEFSQNSECIWTPNDEGDYILMVQAREKNKLRPIDYLAKEDYLIVKREVMDDMDKNIVSNKTISDGLKNNKNNSTTPKDDIIDNFKDYIENEKCDNNSLFFEATNVTEDEKKELIKEISQAKDEIAVSKEAIGLSNYNIKVLTNEKDMELKKKADVNEMNVTEENIIKTDRDKELILKNIENHIIDEIELDIQEMIVGDKCTINVKTSKPGKYLYRFYIKKGKEWSIIRDYESISELKYTANDSGKKEFLIQCKKIDSTENFDDYKIVNINVKEREKLQITNIRCVNDELIAGNKLKFIVDTNIEENHNDKEDLIPLFKFYKINKNGKSICLQDYSTKNEVEYTEEQKGEYRMLCLVKTVLSDKEYDDRAIVVYDVKPYKDIKINSFVANLNSPQATETDIQFTSEVEGGNRLLYRYKVRGPIEIDTDYIESPIFMWNPIEAGEYEIILLVKNFDCDCEYEDKSKIAFTIEKRGKKPIKILDVVVDKEKRIIINEPVNIMVDAEGGTGLLYSFIVRKGTSQIKEINYNKHNFIDFIPKETGDYEVEICVKDKYSDKNYDANTIVYLKCLEYLPGEIDYIILPCQENYLIGDTIEFECIIQNTPEVLVRYETKINGHAIEETEFSNNKKLRFTPKIAGKYTIEVYAKNIKCNQEYDSKKQVSIYVNEALPVISTKIIPNTLEPVVNEEFTIEMKSRGGKDVCYEFYLMENKTWRRVQVYSRKKFYSFIPFTAGKYKILALAKSYYKKVNYEDYAQISFEVKEN